MHHGVVILVEKQKFDRFLKMIFLFPPCYVKRKREKKIEWEAEVKKKIVRVVQALLVLHDGIIPRCFKQIHEKSCG